MEENAFRHGQFAVRNGHLPGVNLAGAAESLAKMAGVGGDTPFTVLEGDINIANQRVSSKQIHLDSSAGIVDLKRQSGPRQHARLSGNGSR